MIKSKVLVFMFVTFRKWSKVLDRWVEELRDKSVLCIECKEKYTTVNFGGICGTCFWKERPHPHIEE